MPSAADATMTREASSVETTPIIPPVESEPSLFSAGRRTSSRCTSVVFVARTPHFR
jgi:hypothetical protein